MKKKIEIKEYKNPLEVPENWKTQIMALPIKKTDNSKVAVAVLDGVFVGCATSTKRGHLKSDLDVFVLEQHRRNHYGEALVCTLGGYNPMVTYYPVHITKETSVFWKKMACTVNLNHGI